MWVQTSACFVLDWGFKKWRWEKNDCGNANLQTRRIEWWVTYSSTPPLYISVIIGTTDGVQRDSDGHTNPSKGDLDGDDDDGVILSLEYFSQKSNEKNICLFNYSYTL